MGLATFKLKKVASPAGLATPETLPFRLSRDPLKVASPMGLATLKWRKVASPVGLATPHNVTFQPGVDTS